MATDNVTILHDIWLNGTNDFQQRVPEPTQSNISKVMRTLFDPMNQMYHNQFIDALLMRIGTTYVHQQSFRNPLREFKKAQLVYGNTIQEMIPKWIRAHSYVDDAEDVFKMARPDLKSWYHSQNRRDRYDITINDIELRTAFTDSEGLNKLVASVMKVPINSDEYDEYRIMLQLIALYENTWGFYKHGLSARPTDEATGKEFLTALRTYAGKLRFPSTTYNNGAIEDIPIFVNPDELVLIITPETQAALDVQTLSGIFQLDKADIKYRTILVDEFPLPDDDCVALLTTRDFFMCCDTVYQNTSMYNPKTLGTNYFLHHWGVYSVSPFVPAIMFKVGDTTTTEIVTQEATGISVMPENINIDAGDTAQIDVELLGSISNDINGKLGIKPNAVVWDPGSLSAAYTVTTKQQDITIGGTFIAGDSITLTTVLGDCVINLTEDDVTSAATVTTKVLAEIRNNTIFESNTVTMKPTATSIRLISEPTSIILDTPLTATTTSENGTVTPGSTSDNTRDVQHYFSGAENMIWIDEYNVVHTNADAIRGNFENARNAINASAIASTNMLYNCYATYVNPSGVTKMFTDTINIHINLDSI